MKSEIGSCLDFNVVILSKEGQKLYLSIIENNNFTVAVELQSIKLVKIIKSFDLVKFEEKINATSDDTQSQAFFIKAFNWCMNKPEVCSLVKPLVLRLVKNRYRIRHPFLR